MARNRCYSELIRLPTFEQRFRYLRIGGQVGIDTFGFDRYLNQRFYRSNEWKAVRHEIIVRDLARDMAHPDYELNDSIYVHHMNPISIEDLELSSEYLLNPEFLVCTSFDTHQAIHYGNGTPPISMIAERRPNDTVPWRS